MATKPEQAFFQWLKSNFPWYFQRIESTTSAGIPDIWACHQGESLWIETKALPATNVQIRAAQYAWMAKVSYNGVQTWVWNRNPRRKTVIQAWCTPFEVAPGKKGHLKITSQPDIALPAESFTNLKIQSFTRSYIKS